MYERKWIIDAINYSNFHLWERFLKRPGGVVYVHDTAGTWKRHKFSEKWENFAGLELFVWWESGSTK